jgi:hypothetical protein
MHTRTRVVGGFLVATLVTQLSACGSVFFPDRRGQIDGKIDPLVAGLNAIGVLFYVIPGLIAFAVDFATGAIYLPDNTLSQVDPDELNKLVGADGQVDLIKLKALIQNQTGHTLPLDDPGLIQHSGSVEQLAAYGIRPVI